MKTNHTIDQLDIYRTLYPTRTEYTFFSSAQRTRSKINHKLGHRLISIDLKIYHTKYCLHPQWDKVRKQ